MNRTSDVPLFEQVVIITRMYLGPAAERFVTRQIQNHLHIDPKDLTPQDLKKLIDWIRIAVSLLTDNIAIINQYIHELEKLADDRI